MIRSFNILAVLGLLARLSRVGPVSSEAETMSMFKRHFRRMLDVTQDESPPSSKPTRMQLRWRNRHFI